MGVELKRIVDLVGSLTRPAGLSGEVALVALRGSLAPLPALVGSLTRPAGLSGEVALVALRGSLAPLPALVGSLTRPAPLVGVLTEEWPPPDGAAETVAAGDLGSWRPRVRGVRGQAVDPWLAWNLIAATAFRESGPPAPDVNLVLYAEGDLAQPPRYAPGPLRPTDEYGRTIDTLRVTDAAAATRDLFVAFREGAGPAGQSLEVPIGTDGVVGVYVREAVALSSSGGTGPYTWEFVDNRSGATLTAGGAYEAGAQLGIDRVKVTDAAGAIAYAQIEVVAVPIVMAFGGDPWSADGFKHLPAARLSAEGGTAPYVFTLHDNQTGGRIIPAYSLPAAGPSSRVTIGFRQGQFGFVDFSRWNVATRLRLADGHYLDEQAALYPVWNGSVEAVLPHPEDLGMWEEQLVLEVRATPADGGETVCIEALFESPSESAYAAAR